MFFQHHLIHNVKYYKFVKYNSFLTFNEAYITYK